MVTIAEWFGRAREISLFVLQWHFITGPESYLVCNGSITMLKKSFELTSQADIYPAKWPTEGRDYQKIKKNITVFCVKLKWNKTEQSISHANIPRCSPTDWLFFFFCLWMFFFSQTQSMRSRHFLTCRTHQFCSDNTFSLSSDNQASSLPVIVSYSTPQIQQSSRPWQLNSFFGATLSYDA